MLQTTLEIETESRFTLIYGNRRRESTMFRDELDELESRYADRLEILHVLSRDPQHTPELCGRIDRGQARALAGADARARRRWTSGSCAGRSSSRPSLRDTLIDHGVDREQIHLELFFGYEQDGEKPAPCDARRRRVTFTLSGREQTVDLKAGDSILEGALQDPP